MSFASFICQCHEAVKKVFETNFELNVELKKQATIIELATIEKSKHVFIIRAKQLGSGGIAFFVCTLGNK